MRALIRTALVVILGAGLVLGARALPDLGYRMAGVTASSDPTGSDSTGSDSSTTTSSRAVSRSALVCPGPETVGVKGVDAKSAAAPTTVRVAAPPSDLLAGVLGGSASPSQSGSVDPSIIGGSGDPAALGFTSLVAPGTSAGQTTAARSILLTGRGSLAPGLAAAQTTLVPSGDQRGLSMSSCQPPSAETWLVGGGGEPGRRGRVVLSNPSPTGVTVDLQVYGAKGPVRSAAARGIVVGAHQRTVVLLDAIAPGERAPVIHVVASGGLISASLNDSWLDGTTPAGADDVVGTAPGRSLVIPGVLVAGGGGTQLRIAATGHEAVVRVRLLGAEGPTAAPVNNGVVRVAAQRAVEVNLAAVSAGAYGIELSSDQPVVAGVEMRPPAGPASPRRDLMWTSAQPAITGLAGFPLGDVVAPWAKGIVLTATAQDAALDLVSVAADGTQTTAAVTVAAGTSKQLPLSAPAASIWVRVRAGAVSAAIRASYVDPAGPLMSVAPLVESSLRATAVSVYPLGG